MDESCRKTDLICLIMIRTFSSLYLGIKPFLTREITLHFAALQNGDLTWQSAETACPPVCLCQRNLLIRTNVATVELVRFVVQGLQLTDCGLCCRYPASSHQRPPRGHRESDDSLLGQRTQPETVNGGGQEHHEPSHDGMVPTRTLINAVILSRAGWLWKFFP